MASTSIPTAVNAGTAAVRVDVAAAQAAAKHLQGTITGSAAVTQGLTATQKTAVCRTAMRNLLTILNTLIKKDELWQDQCLGNVIKAGVEK